MFVSLVFLCVSVFSTFVSCLRLDLWPVHRLPEVNCCPNRILVLIFKFAHVLVTCSVFLVDILTLSDCFCLEHHHSCILCLTFWFAWALSLPVFVFSSSSLSLSLCVLVPPWLLCLSLSLRLYLLNLQCCDLGRRPSTCLDPLMHANSWHMLISIFGGYDPGSSAPSG